MEIPELNHDEAVEKYALIVRTYEGEDYSLKSDEGKYLEHIFYILLDIEESMLSPEANITRNNVLEELVNKKIRGLV
jgi:hypothetical protein